MTIIRAMALQDLDAVLALESKTAEAPHWDRAIYEKVVYEKLGADVSGVRHGAFVAIRAEELVGFIVAGRVLEVCEIESIAVAVEVRREGVGSALLDAISDWAVAGGAERLQLEVRAGNLSAIRFYERAGLINEGVRRGYYRDPEEDAVLMGKPLYSSD
jgi:[ribosomal protein S18]-alanine N-acetyltransferase